MNVLHLLTTGTSLLGHVRDRAVYAPARTVLAHDDVREALRCRAGARGRLELDAVLGPAALGVLAAGDPDHAAEWTSVHLVRASPAFPVAAQECFVFLASDTDRGLRAATFAAAGFEPAPVHYVDEPLTHQGWPGPGEAWVCRVPRLDLSGDLLSRPDGATWRSFGAVGRLVAQTVEEQPDGWTVIVHFSAGYKAVVPYVMVLAEAIRSRLDVTVPVRAVAFHDAEGGAAEPVPVEVPVRRLSSDPWSDVRRVRDALRPGSDVVPAGLSRWLRGLMLERHDATHDRVTVPGLISTHVL